MYAGFIVEHASVDEVYDNPRHPYTKSLLGALPRVDMSRSERLTSIPGMPPNLIGLPKGCPFAPRCHFVLEKCRQENPPLTFIAPKHEIAAGRRADRRTAMKSVASVKSWYVSKISRNTFPSAGALSFSGKSARCKLWTTCRLTSAGARRWTGG